MVSNSQDSPAAVDRDQESTVRGSDCGSCDSSTCSTVNQRSDESNEDFELRQKLENRLGLIDRKLLVLSGKGGVGKSTVAANLAVSLASAGKKVGLLDVDVHGPSIPTLLGISGRVAKGGEDGMIPIRVSENLEVMSIGVLFDDPDAAVIWRGPLKFGTIRQFLRDVVWGELDYLVIDAPPGTGDEPLAVAELIGSRAGAVIVTTPQDLAIADVRRSISFCHEVSLPVVGIIENMSGFECPRCGEVLNIFKTGGGANLARELRVPFLGSIPIDGRVTTSGDAGIPFVEADGKSKVTTAFDRVASDLMDRVDSILRYAAR